MGSLDVRSEWPGIEEKDGAFASYDSEALPAYLDIVRKFGTVLLERADDDYQGDSYILMKKDERFGFLTFGWGSCSGCDALQGCDSYDDLQALVDNMETAIHWGTPGEVAAYMAGAEGRNEWYAERAETEAHVFKSFRRAAIALLDQSTPSRTLQ